MRRILLTTALALPVFGTAGLAQETTTEPATEAPPEMQQDVQQQAQPEAQQEGSQLEAEMAESDQIVREQAENELRVDWITGTTVTATDGDSIGNINDLIIDGETGGMQAAILSVGGFLGIGAKQIAVPWEELQINYDANEISMNLTREEAEAAPEYVFRDQEQPPSPAGMDPAATGAVPAEGTGTLGGGAPTGTMEGAGAPATVEEGAEPGE